MAKKKCECGYVVQEGMRYCKACCTKMRRKLKRSGYLTPVPRQAKFRDLDARENRYETRNGIDE